MAIGDTRSQDERQCKTLFEGSAMAMSEAAILSDRKGPGPWTPSARRAAVCVGALVAAAALTGCASQPKPTAQLVRANTLVSQAEKDQAQRYAAADLQRARDELSSARSAQADGKNDAARSLADRAAVDADLASARASSAKAEQSAEQVHHSLDTLRQQLEQNPAPSPIAGPGQDQP
jgi:hypothetical protein